MEKFVVDVQERRDPKLGPPSSRRFNETDSSKAFKIAMDAERAGFIVRVERVRTRDRVGVSV